MDEHGFGGALSGGFKQIQGAGGIDIKIVERTPGGKIVAGLCGSVDDQIKVVLFEETINGFPITDIEILVVEVSACGQQPVSIPGCVPLRTKEISPHIVVDAADLESEVVEVNYSL